MRDLPPSFLLVAACDRDAASGLALPVDLVVRDGADALWNGAPVPGDRLHLGLCGVLVLSGDGAAALADLAEAWLARFGEALPRTLDLTGVEAAERRGAALAWLAETAFGQRRADARRAVALMREMAVLRAEYEAMQMAFERLETHAHTHRLSERKLLLTLAPVEGAAVMDIPPGSEAVQRLPGGSAGLSDVAIRIHEMPQPRQGVLTCVLESPDLGAEIARWTVPAGRIQSGWLRLSLAKALENDPVGLKLRLGWSGTVPLRLATSMAHPDPRFRPGLAGGETFHRRVLAMELWHFLPGVRAPMSAAGILPDGELDGGTVRRRVEFREMLGAVNLDTLVADLGTPETGGEALLVHAPAEGLACAILPVPTAGVRLISADVLTAHAKGPVVDYAMAVLPTALRPTVPRALPELPEEYHSGWVRQKPMRAGQVTLILPDLPAVPHDLYLMTRLPPGDGSNAFGWSTFSSVLLHV